MRRVIGIDIHRTFGEVVIWESGLTRHGGRIAMIRTALEGFGRQLLETGEVVVGCPAPDPDRERGACHSACASDSEVSSC